MTPKKLQYSLNDGFIDNWLVLGPVSIPVEGFSSRDGKNPERRAEVLRSAYDSSVQYSGDVIDLKEAEIGSEKAIWHYRRCLEDHRVDVSADYADWRISRAYLYAEISVPEPVQVTIDLNSNSMATVWLNGKVVFNSSNPGAEGSSSQFLAELGTDNELVIRLEQLGNQPCHSFAALRMLAQAGPAGLQGVKILLPTQANSPRRFQALENVIEHAHLEEVVNYRGASFKLHWSSDVSGEATVAYQIQDKEERIYVEGSVAADPGSVYDIGHTVRLFERPFRVVLKAPGREYYNLNNRYQREIPLYVLDTQYASEPILGYAERRKEALKDASKHEGHLFGQIARMAQNQWAELSQATLEAAIHAVAGSEAGSDVLLMGLLVSLERYPDRTEIQGLSQAIHEAVKTFKFDPAAPGGDALDFDSEAHGLILAACKILAGQRWEEFSGLQVQSEVELEAWLKEKGTRGFEAWLSNSETELFAAGLATVATAASNMNVRELSAVLLDRVLFDLAVHTYKGTYGTCHGVSQAGMLKSAQLEGTSGISRMLFGMGVYNPAIVGVVSLAISDYEFPTFFAEIAKDGRAEMLSRENHGGVSTVTYRTPDYLLSSVQDYRPGQKGGGEHIWQATLGPDSVVFGTHPANSCEQSGQQAGYWLGNAILPRTAQWKDVVISIHDFKEGEGLGFTHAYFPTYQFDENVLKDGWMFARKNQGYLALTAARGLALVKNGQGGYHELRSYGSPNIWICQMGRADLDGSFEDFKDRINAMRLDWPGNSTQFTSLRGDHIQFGWEGPLVVNGTAQELACGMAVENPYCQAGLQAVSYEIGTDDLVMRLSFE